MSALRNLQIATDLAQLDVPDLEFLAAEAEWKLTARPKQLPPEVDFNLWMIMAGRGFGKTHTGANWSRGMAYNWPGSIGHVVARTHEDLRKTVFEGPAGLLAAIPSSLIVSYNKGTLEILLINQTKILGFSASEPNRLRGPQCHWCWCDELAAWEYVEETWSNVVFSTRLSYKGQNTRTLITTTPRPLPLLQEMVEKSRLPNTKTVVVGGSSYENRANLAESVFEEITKYEGTKIGRQEIHGELIDPGEGAIVSKSWLRYWTGPLPAFEYIVVSLDTAFTEEKYDKKTGDPDYSACGVWGVFYNDKSKRHEILMLECWEERLGYPDLLEKAKKEMTAHYGDIAEPMFVTYVGQKYGGLRKKRHPDVMLVEEKGSGISLRQSMAKEGYPVIAYNPGKASKTERLHAVSWVVKQGYVWLPATEDPKRIEKNLLHRSWCDEFVRQFCSFSGPGSLLHDDHVDEGSQVLKLFSDKYIAVKLPINKNKDEIDEERLRANSRKRSNPYS